MSGNRVTVYEAADRLGLSVDAIRKRVQRGAIPYEKDAAGRVHILLDESSTLQDEVHDSYEPKPNEMLEELREQNAYLREVIATRDEEIRRRDYLLAAAMERIPELDSSLTEEDQRSPSEGAAYSDATDGEGAGAAPTDAERETAGQEPRRSWWHKLIGR